ncbi:MAG: hypothetical protein IIB56_12645 [Planctomycetes bacterium]|nr:hypothetical protein [Planctomycetota bacterium]MCH8119722.1 hypothetical protein [Planctomycetota bacterium]
MIKTLRITSVVAAVLAVIVVIFFVFHVVFGSDDRIEELLNSPGVMEKFNKTVGNKSRGGASQESPLVKQAGAFALYLNPPKPKTPKTATGRTTGITRGPAVTPKFKVIGISYYKKHPELSIALIDEPGKGLHWVRQSSKVGHLLIEQIKDGLIVVKDGQGTFELEAEQNPEASLLEGASAVPPGRANISRRTPGAAGSRPALPAPRRTGTGITDARSRVPQPRSTAEEDAKRTEIAEMITQIQRSFKSDKTGSVPNAKEKAEMVKKLMHELSELQSSKSSRLSAEEAKRLSTLGKDLKKVWEEPDSKKTKSVK